MDHSPLHDQFIAELKYLWWLCGSPAVAKIEETSARLGELYSQSDRIKDLPSVSGSAISAVLNGQRDKIPNGAWVAAYVISCLHLGWKIGAVPKPTADVLTKWQYKRYLACGGPDVSPWDPPSPGTGTPEPPLSAPIMPITENPGNAEIPRLDAEERADLERCGTASRLLLDRYASGDADACYQLAVLLAAEFDRAGTSHRLLLYAAAEYHPAAAELLNDRDKLTDPAQLAVHADLIAQTAGDPPIIVVFSQCAHACRNRPARPDRTALG